MASNSISLKQCSSKNECKHPLKINDGWLPATRDYFPVRKASRDHLGYICKECNRYKTAKWAEDNPEKAQASSKKYRDTHKDNQKEYWKTYYPENSEKLKQRTRDWSKANPDRKKLADQQYHKRTYDRAKTNESVKRWRKANPEQHRAQLSKRRARKMNAEGHYSAQDVRDLYEEQQGLCAYCGIRLFDEYHIDHVVPLVRGGTNWPDNLLLACPDCNLLKGDKLLPEWESTRGW